MSLSESFSIPDIPGSEDNDDEIDSLPSTSTEDFDSDDDADYEDAQREWETSMQQLELLLTMILIPFAGKYFGRKFAYWSMILFLTSHFHFHFHSQNSFFLITI